MVPNEGVNTDDRARVEVVNVPEPARSGVCPGAVLGVFPAILTLLRGDGTGVSARPFRYNDAEPMQEKPMLTLVPQEIEEYAVRHTTPLPAQLAELARYTAGRDDGMMLSGPVEGTLLQMLVWALGARRVLEVGCFTGFSAQMMASALPDDGRLVTCEIDPGNAEVAREYFDRGPDGHKIEIRLGPAIETMKSLEGPFDFVFIDADKTPYVDYYERAMDLLADRGIIAVDNVLWSGRVLDPKSDSDRAMAAFNDHVSADPRVRQVILTVRDGLMLIRKV